MTAMYEHKGYSEYDQEAFEQTELEEYLFGLEVNECGSPYCGGPADCENCRVGICPRCENGFDTQEHQAICPVQQTLEEAKAILREGIAQGRYGVIRRDPIRGFLVYGG